jgi:hypothetical protein
MDLKDLLRVGDAQMRNPTVETGALLLGAMQGTTFQVQEAVGLGLGDNPGSNTFEVGDPTRTAVQDELRVKPTSTWSFAHTHGPLLGADANGPSSTDLRYSGQLEQNDRYGVSLVAKVNADGGGYFTFFDGQGNTIPWVLTGLDGKKYSQAEVRRSGWGNAWGRDRHGLSSTQPFHRSLSPVANNTRAAA